MHCLILPVGVLLQYICFLPLQPCFHQYLGVFQACSANVLVLVQVLLSRDHPTRRSDLQLQDHDIVHTSSIYYLTPVKKKK